MNLLHLVSKILKPQTRGLKKPLHTQESLLLSTPKQLVFTLVMGTCSVLAYVTMALLVLILIPMHLTRDLKNYYKNSVAKRLAAAEAAGVDTLVGVYHSDHREFSGHQEAWPFEVVNYMELIGESMGISRPDLFKHLKLMADADAIVAASTPLIEANGLNPEEARDVVLSEMLGDQHLPVDRALHPAE